ncbi:transporter [Thalassomonas sp. M1454]|uniref:transporter n=1 Tax=Thalassomonas sp. M1454 TaxID=2594477 RepID=UPI00117F190B|nr:transporter [Thalassomonas sp. M1454]TRX53152.1 transporter [Thalassomonas sp. M1454]
MLKNIIKTIYLTCALLPFTLTAQELDPRSYVDLPTGQNFLGALYVYTDGDVYTSPEVPIENLNLQIHGPALAYARTFSLFGNSTKFDINQGQACADGDAILQGEYIERSFCGLTDTRIRLNYNFYGAKAKSLAEYVKQPKGIVVGTSLQVSIPTGEYEKQYVFNVGANRWFVKPEIGMSIPHGPWELDLSASVKIFSDNDDYLYTQTLKQDNIYNIQSHLIYDISPGQWIALNANYFWGGDTHVDGVQKSNKAGNYRAGITYSLALSSQHSIKFLANTGVTTKRGNDSDVFAIAWAYRWQ